MVTIYYGSSGSGKSYMLRKNKPGKRPLVYTDNKEKQREWNEKGYMAMLLNESVCDKWMDEKADCIIFDNIELHITQMLHMIDRIKQHRGEDYPVVCCIFLYTDQLWELFESAERICYMATGYDYYIKKIPEEFLDKKHRDAFLNPTIVSLKMVEYNRAEDTWKYFCEDDMKMNPSEEKEYKETREEDCA